MEGSASGCPSHHHHRAGALIHHCAALAKRSAVLFNGRSAHFGRHDVLHHRRRDRHDPHGRAHRYRHDKNEKARCRYHAFVFARLYHHGLGAGLTGARIAGAVRAEFNSHSIRRMRCRRVSRRVASAHAVFYRAAAVACRMLRRRIPSGVLCPAGISRRRVRFRRRRPAP